MRTLGPGSVSSVLKTVLDVVYVALIVAAGGLVIAMFAALLFRLDPAVVKDLSIDGASGEALARGEVLTAIFVTAGLYLAGVLVIVHQLRRIFSTLSDGDPFHPDNVARLRLVGVLLAGLELTRYLVWAGSLWLLQGLDRTGPSISLSGWFSILVVFVLAEVFREGARLRREAELTI